MKNPLFVLLTFTCFAAFAQQSNTQRLIYNFPLNKGKEAVTELLLKDTLHFNSKTPVNGIYYFFPVKQDSFFYSTSKNIELQIRDFKYPFDSITRPEIALYIRYDKVIKTREMKAFYTKLTEALKTDYADVKYEYIKVQRKEVRKASKVDEYSAKFYINKGDALPKCTVVWFDEHEYGHFLMLFYCFD